VFADMPEDAPPTEVGRRQGLLVEQAAAQLGEMQQVAPACGATGVPRSLPLQSATARTGPDARPPGLRLSDDEAPAARAGGPRPAGPRRHSVLIRGRQGGRHARQARTPSRLSGRSCHSGRDHVRSA
jgi:hypothetical protein